MRSNALLRPRAHHEPKDGISMGGNWRSEVAAAVDSVGTMPDSGSHCEPWERKYSGWVVGKTNSTHSS